MNPLAALLLPLCLWLTAGPAAAGDYSDRPEAQRFVQLMVEKHGLDRQEVQALIDAARRKQSILDAISRPAEAKPWYQYRPIFVNQARIEGGVDYWNRNARILDQVREALAVDPALVVAIIGVETRYGRHAGRYRVLDALATLGFDYPPRADFFRGQLEQFLLLAREEGVDPLKATGSYAGAMGHGQFIPSSYRRYAVDFDGDGQRDLWNSRRDIIASVANYLRRHGWQLGGPVALRARVSGESWKPLLDKGLKPSLPVTRLAGLGIRLDGEPPAGEKVALLALEGRKTPEYWAVFNNFHVITRYNRSPLYAMAVHQLAEAISEARAAGEPLE
ncbi:lytic murein transglycosylase B [Thiohalobacter sp. IOR34]|uniref:lytic murein transglycosylase B n=1 Tax=Thiohalobacter sp. IOR34 TaxID=3057176 RepID=UPI0025B00EAD|nr:lytic murein transglycosylase B [Thiohalobacter sp. IOR34]WJW75929.1 lytic murein transglycosylase B [Thiohalobacter sp. IOR34]